MKKLPSSTENRVPSAPWNEPPRESDLPPPQQRRVIVASARLPVALSRNETTGWSMTSSPGGLVTGLQPVTESRGLTWIGWPGTHVPEADQDAVSEVLAEKDLIPIFADADDLDGFYLGFSNGVLWPLFHSLSGRAFYDDDAWEAYRRVNRVFAEAIAAQAGPGDIIWIHDYQLCLVPEMLRDLGVHNVIGFFLHIPFPSAEIYRRLPVREEVLWGLLGADVLGFHTYEYVSHFRSSTLRILGLESDATSIRTQSRQVNLAVAPIGIDPTQIDELSRSEEAIAERELLRHSYAGKTIVVAVDRLDYTKGIPEKLRGFEALLERCPHYREKVVLVQIAAPTRTGVDEYQNLKRDVEGLVGRINGRFGTASYVPVVYINQSVSRSRLVGVFQVADIALLTPLRDGMNLVALEYVAARAGKPGSLILSEFTGAARWLSGAILVNPYSDRDIAMGLEKALDEPPDAASFRHMQDFVRTNTSANWGRKMVDHLTERKELAASESLDVINGSAGPLLKSARKPLMLLDYDGTLRSFVNDPKAAAPTARLLRVLTNLCRVATVYIISGRDGETLEQWLGHLPVGFACEHGFATRHPGQEWEHATLNPVPMKRIVEPLLQSFVDRTPGSRIEYKKAGLVWHYRAVDPEYGLLRATELLPMLDDRLKRRPYSVLRGNKVIEVRHEMVSKGHAAARILEYNPDCDVIFAAGDDRTDEETMESLGRLRPEETVACWVGGRNNRARYWVDDSSSLMTQLERLVSLWSERKAPAGGRRRAPKR